MLVDLKGNCLSVIYIWLGLGSGVQFFSSMKSRFCPFA